MRRRRSKIGKTNGNMSLLVPFAEAQAEARFAGLCIRERHLETARTALLDTLAVSFASATAPVLPIVMHYVATQPGGEAIVWVTGEGLTAEAAAFANATIAHALDFDDVAPQWRGHPSAVIFPALLAMANRAPLDSVLVAYIHGYAFGTALGEAMGPEHYRRGWHTTATIGTMAAAYACAHLLGLDAARAGHGVSLAASQASGMQANFGSPSKPAQAGFASAAAVRSVLLALSGLEAGADSVSGPKGFADLYGGPQSGLNLSPLDADAVLQVEPKRFPNCYAAHRAVNAALRLHERHGQSLAGADRVEIASTANAHMPLLKREPATPDEAKFSIEYCVAAALLDGRLDMTAFTPEVFARPDVRALRQRVVVSDAVLPNAERASRVTVELAGSTDSEEVAGPIPVDHEGVIAKADDNLARLGNAGFGSSLDLVLRECATVKDLLASATLRSLADRFTGVMKQES